MPLPLIALRAVILAAALPGYALAAGVDGDSPAPAARPAGAAAPAADGLALREPRPGLFTAGQPASTAWSALADRGVATVINLRTPEEMEGRDEPAEVRAAGLDYLNLPVAGAGDVTAEQADALWRALQAADGPVLVHCASGNRVGALLALAMRRHGGMTAEEALGFGRSAGLTGLEPVVRERLGMPAATPEAASPETRGK